MFRKGIGNSRSERRESKGTCDVMRGSWLKDEIDPDLLDRGVPMFTERALTETTLTLNRRWFVEWEDETGIVEVELGSILFHNLIVVDDKIGIEVHSALPNSFHPETRKLFFSSEEDRLKVSVLFEKSRSLVQQMTYSRDMVPMFLQREFKNLGPKLIDDLKKIEKDAIRRYFRHSDLDVPRDALTEDAYSFKDWQEVYDNMMGQQTSKMLQSVFEHNSVWAGENTDRKMSPKDLEDFLTKHQEESRHYSREDILDIMLRHKKEEICSHQGERKVEQYISWSFEEFTSFLLSKENCITDPRMLNLQQDNMYQPLSRYWINSSFKTQGVGDDTTCQAFDIALRKGVRHID